MSATRTQRIIEAIAECSRFIDFESARADDLRPKAMADLLERYKAHRERLTAMLAAA